MRDDCGNSDFWLTVCCAIAVTLIASVILWMDQDDLPMRSDIALREAEKSVLRFCDAQGLSTCDMQLINATSTQATQTQSQKPDWNFQFFSPSAGPVTVKVKTDGEVNLLHEDPGKPTVIPANRPPTP